MRADEVIKRITALGSVELRQRGSHRVFRAAKGKVSSQVTVPITAHATSALAWSGR